MEWETCEFTLQKGGIAYWRSEEHVVLDVLLLSLDHFVVLVFFFASSILLYVVPCLRVMSDILFTLLPGVPAKHPTNVFDYLMYTFLSFCEIFEQVICSNW